MQQDYCLGDRQGKCVSINMEHRATGEAIRCIVSYICIVWSYQMIEMK